MIRIFLILIFFACVSFSKEQLYILPKEAKTAKEALVKAINKSKSSIDIAMYNFTYKKFAKALIKAHKRGVKVRVLLDESKIKGNTKFHELKKAGIKCFTLDEKMHIKAALFDDKSIFLGSTNWKKESFTGNYEVLSSTTNSKIIKKFKIFFDSVAP